MFKFKVSLPSVNGSQNVKGSLPSVYDNKVDGKKWKDLKDNDIQLINDFNKLKEAITTFCKNGKQRPKCKKTWSLIIAVRKACGGGTYGRWNEPLDTIQRETLIKIIDPDKTIRGSTSYDVKRQMINFLQGKDNFISLVLKPLGVITLNKMRKLYP